MRVRRGSTDGVQAELARYAHRWNEMMVRIWRDRLGLFGAIRTRALFDSLMGASPDVSGYSANFLFRFLHYGIYVDRGTGNGYRAGNGGDLAFLGKGYRSLHNLGKARKKRPWFSRSLAISQRVLAEKYSDAVGDEFSGMVEELL